MLPKIIVLRYNEEEISVFSLPFGGKADFRRLVPALSFFIRETREKTASFLASLSTAARERNGSYPVKRNKVLGEGQKKRQFDIVRRNVH